MHRTVRGEAVHLVGVTLAAPLGDRETGARDRGILRERVTRYAGRPVLTRIDVGGVDVRVAGGALLRVRRLDRVLERNHVHGMARRARESSVHLVVRGVDVFVAGRALGNRAVVLAVEGRPGVHRVALGALRSLGTRFVVERVRGRVAAGALARQPRIRFFEGRILMDRVALGACRLILLDAPVGRE
jgi:hypothetical protein